MRQRIPLNFDWWFTPDFSSDYIGQTQPQNSELIAIPHTMKELPYHYFDEETYQYIGTYTKTILITEEMLNQRLFIRFEAVMNVAKIYWNKELLMIHEGGYTPFQVDITNQAKEGDNLLQVIVDSTEIKEIPPFGNLVDYLAFSGIYREVTLLVYPKTYIQTLQVSYEEGSYLLLDEMILQFRLGLENPSKADFDVLIRIYDGEREVLNHRFDEVIQEENYYNLLVTKIERWSVDAPKLYTLEVCILNQEEVWDTQRTTIGFRTASFTTEGFLLNNQPLKLIGLNRHQSYPYVGYAMPKSMQELDADLLKQYGCNIVRTSHYMQSEHFLRRCDEIGLLVLEEIPGWQYIGDEHFKELTYQNIEAMIQAHFNHPSIVTWGVRINESIDDHDFYQKTNELARELDPTRQTCGIRNQKKSELLEDIYTYNDFYHNGYNQGLEAPDKVTKGYVPYLVTEHNGHMFPTKKFDTEERRVDHALRHLNVLDSAFSYKRVSGAIGWCMADYNTHIQFGSNDRICYHGVMDMFRIPKYASYAYQSQTNQEPMIYVASNMMSGDHSEFKLPEVVVFTNCDSVKLYKNDSFVGEYYPEESLYPNLPHPPIFIDDLIGNLLVEQGIFPQKQAKTITRLLNSFKQNGFNMPLKDKIPFGLMMARKKLTYPQIFQLFEEHIALQSNAPVIWKLEGYIDEELVVSTSRGHTKNLWLSATSNTDVLYHDETYDVARIVVELKDEYGSESTYSNLAFRVSTSKHLEVIGPSNLSLIGGSVGVYVKTTGLDGEATLTIQSDLYPDIMISFNVIKEKGLK